MTGGDSIPRLLHEDPAPPAVLAMSTLGRDDRPARSVRRGNLLAQVEQLAAIIHERGLVGRPVLIPERNGLEYAVAFLACLRAGAMAVTAHPPRVGGGGERLAAIVRHSRPAAVVASPGLLETIDRTAPDLLAEVPRIEFEAESDDLSSVAEGAEVRSPAADPSVPWPSPDAIGLLQYTSGSTRDPAPVALTHANLLANGVAMRGLFREDGPERPAGDGDGGTVCWMPLYHDMGLIGLFLSSLLVKVPFHLMEPEAFVMRPARWLRAISNTRATYSGGPCFAYDLCVDRVPEEERDALDLSNWRFAFNGAEPVRPSSLARFQAAFGRCGFDGMMPCYGLAEHTLLVSVRRRADPVRYRVADRAALDHGRLDVRRTMEIGEEAPRIDPDEIGVAACGGSIPGHEIVIRDPESGDRLEDGLVGEITLRGPSVAVGYHERAESNAVTFPTELGGEPGPWLRTGDLGALVEGDLHVLGRLKDLLIVDGRNVHPADVEASLESAHPLLEGGRVVVVAAGDPLRGETESVVVVVEPGREIHRAWRRDEAVARSAIREIVTSMRSVGSSVHGIRFSKVVVVPPNAIPRTTSGKVRRSEVARMIDADEFTPLTGAVNPC